MNIENVLELIKVKIEAINPIPDIYLVSKGNDNGFEKLVPIIATEVAKAISGTDTLEVVVHLGHNFPDMDLILNGEKFGLELKSRNNGQWTTNGNSVLESISDPDYDEIYLLFGSKVPKHQRILVKYLPYWKATKTITVTHSPRFTIDSTGNSQSVFKSKDEYDTLRNLDEQGKVSFLQEYLKNNTNGTKWYIADNNSIPPTFLGDLSLNEQDAIIAELFILFPKDLIGNKSNNYKRSSEHLISRHFIYTPYLRDKFSAGGKYNYSGENFSQVYRVLKDLAPIIISLLSEASPDFINQTINIWKKDGLLITPSNDLIDDYKTVINNASSKNNKLTQSLNNIQFNKLSDFIFQ